MRETFVSILALLAVASPTKSSDIGKDGFNFYKDYLRSRTDEVVIEEPNEDRVVYYYRTPLSLYPNPSLLPLPAVDQEYKKRTGNVYKNHLLSKDLRDGAAQSKRSSKTALSFLMQGKHPYYPDDASAGNSEEIPLN